MRSAELARQASGLLYVRIERSEEYLLRCLTTSGRIAGQPDAGHVEDLLAPGSNALAEAWWPAWRGRLQDHAADQVDALISPHATLAPC